MAAPLDVFAVKNNEPECLGCAETLNKAVELMCETGTGSYLVFSRETGHANLFEVGSDGRITLAQ